MITCRSGRVRLRKVSALKGPVFSRSHRASVGFSDFCTITRTAHVMRRNESGHKGQKKRNESLPFGEILNEPLERCLNYRSF